MSVEKYGRYHHEPHVSYMRWRVDNEGDKQLGLRVGYANGFVWIPEHEAINLANRLVDFIENPPANTTRAQENNA
ncbi:hypothetical protein [Brachybacterium alimentarium]|uniref:hypothetical protein n=1 Tax=Brachybacterium alimentarium TaxID=47845 RepID=UPI003FD6B1EE